MFSSSNKIIIHFCFIILFFTDTLCGAAKEIAFTFDDAPRGDTELLNGTKRARLLIRNLRRNGDIKAAFFCNSERIKGDAEKRIERYARAGHFIANHTHNHKDLDVVGPETFIKDIQEAHEVLSKITNFKPWFRFPYLREGKTIEDRDEVRKELKRLGYSQGYVTVDNYDWFMDKMLQNALLQKRKIDWPKLRDTYIDVLTSAVEFYDDIAVATLKRSPRHVLLLHENDLAAFYIGDLADALRKKGWKIISPETAYKDPIALEEPKTLKLGQGRIAALAIDKGYTKPVVRDLEDENALEKLFQDKKVWE